MRENDGAACAKKRGRRLPPSKTRVDATLVYGAALLCNDHNPNDLVVVFDLHHLVVVAAVVVVVCDAVLVLGVEPTEHAVALVA